MMFSEQLCGSGILILDPNFLFPDLKDSGSRIRIRIEEFLTPKNCFKLATGMFIPDPDFFLSRVRIQGSKKHRKPDPKNC
jgi:hypothetical protein